MGFAGGSRMSRNVTKCDVCCCRPIRLHASGKEACFNHDNAVGVKQSTLSIKEVRTLKKELHVMFEGAHRSSSHMFGFFLVFFRLSCIEMHRIAPNESLKWPCMTMESCIVTTHILKLSLYTGTIAHVRGFLQNRAPRVF